MSTIVKALKAEIQRIVRREIAQLAAAQKQGLGVLKKTQTASKQRIDALEKLLKAQIRSVKRSAPAPEPSADAPDNLRVNAKSIKSMRKRLGITQGELAGLLGVSVQVISVWETKKGRVNIRDSAARAELAALKQAKKADVYARLGKEVKSKKSSGTSQGTSRKRGADTSGGLVPGFDSAAIIQLRERLGISQHALSALVGVSNQLVSVWERKQGPLKLRAATARQLSEVMKMSKTEAKKRLG
jgi:DNA-binding transcriptional regulator YiaG